MTQSGTLEQIWIYPIKSFPGVSLASAEVLPTGALRNDRRMALTDVMGKLWTGKRSPRFCRLDLARFDPATGSVELADAQTGTTWSGSLWRDRDSLQDWLSRVFGSVVQIAEDQERGLPDDHEAPGPTVVSRATLEAVADGFSLPLDEVRRRFRANLEVAGVPAFWEDSLFGAPGSLPAFDVGAVRFLGVNPCRRCLVPARQSRTGENDPSFAKRFGEFRAASLPPWANRDRFDHFYRLAVNTRLPHHAPGGVIQVGDAITRVIDP